MLRRERPHCQKVSGTSCVWLNSNCLWNVGICSPSALFCSAGDDFIGGFGGVLLMEPRCMRMCLFDITVTRRFYFYFCLTEYHCCFYSDSLQMWLPSCRMGCSCNRSETQWSRHHSSFSIQCVVLSLFVSVVFITENKMQKLNKYLHIMKRPWCTLYVLVLQETDPPLC